MNTDSPRGRSGRRTAPPRPRPATAPRPLRAQLRETVAAAILDAAEEVMVARGLPGASMQAIADKAGIAVGTLYNYHRDRDDLIAALFTARRAVLVPHLEAAADAEPGAGFEQRLRGFVHRVMAQFEQQRRFMRVALEAEHLKLKPVKGRTSHKQVLQTIHDGLTQIVGAGVAEGMLVGGRDALYARLIAGLIRGSVLLRTETDEPLDTDADVIVDTFLHGATRRQAAP